MEEIRILNKEDIDNYIHHLARHLPETGINGIITGIYAPDETVDKERMKKRILARWETPVGKGDWETAWGIFNGSQIVGHLDLIGNSTRAMNHRARLGMGIEAKYRSRGLGRKLLSTAIDWSQGQEFLSWIDLDVFAHNSVALKLYESLGFQPVGKTIDRLRVGGQSIDDWHLVLKL